MSLDAGNGVRDQMVQEEAELGLYLAWGVGEPLKDLKQERKMI